jgi:hypothetical protein
VNSIPPSEIHGIEVYPGPSTIPAEYASMRRDAVRAHRHLDSARQVTVSF